MLLTGKRFHTTGKDRSTHFSTLSRERTSGYKREGSTVLYLLFGHYFYPNRQGGTERFVFNAGAPQLGEKGHRVKVFTLGTADCNEYPFSVGDILYRTFPLEGLEVVEDFAIARHSWVVL